MPSRTSTKGSREAPDISCGRTKWSAMKIAAAPTPPIQSAVRGAALARKYSTTPATTSMAPNGTVPNSPVARPQANGWGTPKAA